MMKKILFLLAINVLSLGVLQAQHSEVYTESDRIYKNAYELFIKEKYSAAADVFDHYLETANGTDHNRINASFYGGICAFELFHPDAEKRLVDFTQKYPESTKASRAWFYLGRYYYRNKQYHNALPAFEKADIYYLTGDEIPEYYFKTGYCYFSKKENEKAAKNFHEILEVSSKYQTAAQYYYGHIAYASNNYKTAIEYFRKLDSSATFGPLVPYYISQMYYEQGKYDELIKYATDVLKKSVPQNNVEITRLVAEAYYRKGDYENALLYFDAYRQTIPVVSRDDRYCIAYCEYRTKDYTNAIDNFEKVTADEDSLAQNAYYHLADCFIKTNNKQSARTAFQSAAKLNYNAAIKETAQFNYAKLSYELGFQPVAINAFHDFLKDYPNSANADEANELLAGLYLTTKNYKDALTALDNIKNKNTRTKEAYQKVAYYHGVQFYNDGALDKSIGMFEKAIINDINPDLKAEAIYWKAEVLYAQAKYDVAVKQYRTYIFNPGSVNTSMYNLGNYNLGYCHFKLANYAEAQTWFRKYLAKKNENEKSQYDDALIRTGDCFYATRNFDNALDYYNQAIAAHAASGDYCVFQVALIQGIQGKQEEKSATLASLLSAYPKSKYKADAIFEKGRALMTAGKNEEAKTLFTNLLSDYPNSHYNKGAQLNIGLIYYADKKDEQALDAFKKVISNYPGTPESAEALTSVKNIYIANGKPDDYFAYVKNIPNASVSAGAQDSITYEAAEQRYLKGNFTDAAGDFNKYLQQYPTGAFHLNATFYKAECDFRNNNSEDALKGYESILAEQKNIFTEKSLLKAATLNYKNKQYDKAIAQFLSLEQSADLRDNILASQLGLMRSYYFSNKFEQAITYAQKLLNAEKVSNENESEAHLVYGRSSLQSNDLPSAKREFNAIAKQSSAAGAEAKYSLALVENKLNNFKSSQAKCYEVINQVPSYDYWIGKSFILLADDYLALKDTFQTKHTLKSILDNYEKNADDPEDIKAIAQQKYDALSVTVTKEVKKPDEQPDPETDLDKEKKN